MAPPGRPAASRGLATFRRLVLALLVFGLTATALDLYLLAHFEDSLQLVPLLAIALALAALIWMAASRGRVAVRAFQASMALLLATGVVGVVLHYRGNMEFQIEINPSQGGWELFNKVVRAKAPPAMAPGAMAQLGLLGLIATYRHPALTRDSRDADLSPSTGA